MLDKEGSEKPLVFLASSQDELVEACELVKGDSKVKATFWCRVRLSPQSQFPEVCFVSTCLPFLDSVGKVVTRRVWKWSTEDFPKSGKTGRQKDEAETR